MLRLGAEDPPDDDQENEEDGERDGKRRKLKLHPDHVPWPVACGLWLVAGLRDTYMSLLAARPRDTSTPVEVCPHCLLHYGVRGFDRNG